jgi:hypothetical protein
MCTVAARKMFTFVPQAQAEVAVFHNRLEAGRYNEIYAAASPVFQANTQEATFQKYLGTIHSKMGACKPLAKALTYFANSNQSGSTARFTYRIECSNGPLDEVITFRVEDGVPRLFRYQASSPFQMK